MNNNLTELVFILDRSGSMAGLESDTIGGFNGMLSKQKKEQGEAIVTTVLFDNLYEILHDRINLAGVMNISDSDYYVRGCTALLDAIGKTISKISNAQKHTAESERPAKTLVVIITDGLENASREYSAEKVKQMIETMQKDESWEFIFLGANIDAVKTAQSVGIRADRAANYHADGAGTAINYESVCRAASTIRTRGKVSSDWKDDIDIDFKGRK